MGSLLGRSLRHSRRATDGTLGGAIATTGGGIQIPRPTSPGVIGATMARMRSRQTLVFE